MLEEIGRVLKSFDKGTKKGKKLWTLFEEDEVCILSDSVYYLLFYRGRLICHVHDNRTYLIEKSDTDLLDLLNRYLAFASDVKAKGKERKKRLHERAKELGL